MSETLSTLRDRVELLLEDTTNTKWPTTELDEAIQHALDAYSLHLPRRAIATVDVESAAREIDISSLTYTDIERVWWDYDSSDPAYPPHWRSFQVWPGDILFVDDPECPAADDVVRIWYTCSHTIKDLASATATTVPDLHMSLLATGAAALAATARRVYLSENANTDNEWAPRNIKEWAEARLSVFYTRLDELARARADLAAGTAPLSALDRWDGDNLW